MPLLARYRRWWIAAVLAILALPILIELVTPRQTTSQREARPLAAAPTMPRSMADWLVLPRAAEKFITDHFGLRDTLVRTNARLRYAISSPSNPGVMYGRDNQLFFNGDGMLQQATGEARRTGEIARFADFAAGLHKNYQARGITFLVAIAPNATSIARPKLPGWFRVAPDTEYDMMLRALLTRAVPTVDLRLPLIAVNESAAVFRRADTHWNQLGALVAYNEVVARLDRPDWIVEPGIVFRDFTRTTGGDLARMLGAPDDVFDLDAIIDLAAYLPAPVKTEPLDTHKAETGGNVTETGRNGPNVVVLGDSYTEHAWRDYFALHARRFAWIHHELCDFDPAVVAAQKPDIVIFAPAERFMFCWNLKSASATLR